MQLFARHRVHWAFRSAISRYSNTLNELHLKHNVAKRQSYALSHTHPTIVLREIPCATSLASNLATTHFLLMRGLASDSFSTTLRIRCPCWTHVPEPELRLSNSQT